MGNRSSSSKGTSMVKYVESDGEWMELMEQSKEKLVVVDFTASW
jgi:thiol:disulfide interchange protein